MIIGNLNQLNKTTPLSRISQFRIFRGLISLKKLNRFMRVGGGRVSLKVSLLYHSIQQSQNWRRLKIKLK